jgi:ribosomal 30S subunit maturation factor RimM
VHWEIPPGAVQVAPPPAPEGTYYHYELVGCRCFEGERELGTVVEVAEGDEPEIHPTERIVPLLEVRRATDGLGPTRDELHER